MSPLVDFGQCATLADALEQVADRYPDRPALIDRGRTFSFGELQRGVGAVAQWLARLVPAHQRCAVFMDNVFEHVVAWFAVQRAGLVLVPVNVNLAGPEVRHQLLDAEATTVLVSPALLGQLGLALGGTPPAVGTVVVVRSWREEGAFLPEITADTQVVSIEPTTLPTAEVTGKAVREDPAVVWYTTGTTGHPKGALHTHGSCVAAVEAWIGEWDWRPEDRGLIRNLYHVGMMATVVALLLTGASLVFSEPFTIESYLGTVQRHRVTILRTFPVMLALMDKRQEALQGLDLSSVRRVGVGGSGVDRALLERSIERFDAALWDYSWSQSELNSGGTNVSGPAWLDRLASCGRPISCISELTIQDEKGHRVAPETVGEVCVRSPTEMVGYLHAPEATAETKRGGWLHTGDLGYLDAEGYLYLVARSRDVIIRGGENVYPAEIEQVLAGHPSVEDCAAVAAPDSVMGEVPVAFVVLRSDDLPGSGALEDLVARHLARYKRPTRIEIIDQIPRNALGKVQRTVLESIAARYAR